MDLLIDLLLLTILASMANSTKRPILSGIVFGVIKAVSVYLIHIVELNTGSGQAIAIGLTHLILNSFLGIAIAFIVVKHAKNPRMVAVMPVLSGLSFLTHIASLNVTSLFA
jgi:hypothetical protein